MSGRKPERNPEHTRMGVPPASCPFRAHGAGCISWVPSTISSPSCSTSSVPGSPSTCCGRPGAWAIGPSVTSENVHHLQPLELIDMQLFSGAVEDPGRAAVPVIERAVAGAQEPDELTALSAAG
jgi:hypothetical protein